MNDTDLSPIRDVARQMLKNAAFSGLDHAERVRQIAEDIGRREGADLDVLRVAALLHDIGVPIDRERHYEIGARLARGILAQLGFTEDEIEPIAHAIEAHSRYGGPDPQTLEAQILEGVHERSVGEFFASGGERPCFGADNFYYALHLGYEQ